MYEKTTIKEKRKDVTFTTFDPFQIKWQGECYRYVQEIKELPNVFEILLTGAYGSAKSTLMAHLAVEFALENPGAQIAICRKALPHLKQTIFKKISEHIKDKNLDRFIKKVYDPVARIKFTNGSVIFPVYWADKNYTNVRSYDIHMAIFEELTENNDEDKQAYDEIIRRLGRDPYINSYSISATNPDSPRHWAYDYFFKDKTGLKKVFYSKTKDNIFLPPTYYEKLRSELDPRSARRFLDGEWLEIQSEVIYYAYKEEVNFLKKDYEVNKSLPIDITFDFNIALGKPMSAAICQYDSSKDTIHAFDEAVVHGANTASLLEDIAARGLLDNYSNVINVFGDATGAASSSKSLFSDYDIIRKFLSNYVRKDGSKLILKMKVPTTNPPIRMRHQKVNAYCLNDKGESRLFVYQKAKTLNKGLLLTSFKKGAEMVEDDSKDYQHITTALGYYICWIDNAKQKGNPDAYYRR